MQQEIYTIATLAKYLIVSENTIRNLIKSEQIEAFKVGSDWRIKHESVEKFINRKGDETQ